MTAIYPQATSLTMRLSPKRQAAGPHLTGGETEAWREEATTHADATCEQGQDSERGPAASGRAHSWSTEEERDVLVLLPGSLSGQVSDRCRQVKKEDRVTGLGGPDEIIAASQW